jgi:hypothetical protein
LTESLKKKAVSVDTGIKSKQNWVKHPGGYRMSKKHEGHSQKKKLTKKELKALNHAKLMASKGHGAEVINLNAMKEDKNKKAA